MTALINWGKLRGPYRLPAPDDLFTELEIFRPPQALDYRRISSLFGCCSQGAFKKGKSGLQRHLHYW